MKLAVKSKKKLKLKIEKKTPKTSKFGKKVTLHFLPFFSYLYNNIGCKMRKKNSKIQNLKVHTCLPSKINCSLYQQTQKDQIATARKWKSTEIINIYT